MSTSHEPTPWQRLTYWTDRASGNMRALQAAIGEPMNDDYDDYDDWADRGMGRLSSMFNHPAAQITEPNPACDLCHEPIRSDDEQAEMFNPANPDAASVICHAQCGLDQGMEIA